MTSAVDLLNRAIGTLTPTEFIHIENARSLEALQFLSWPRFGHPVKQGKGISHETGSEGRNHKTCGGVGEDGTAIAHRAGVNTITIDRFEGR